jgi:hypothetical protein
MTNLTIHWPDEATERIEAARGRLEVSGPALAARSLEERTRLVGEVFDRWANPAAPERAALFDAHPGFSGFSRETLEVGLELGLAPYTGEALAALADRELAAPSAAGSRLAPFATTSILLAGAIPMPALLQIGLSLVAGSPTLVRPSTRDPVSAAQVRASVEAVDVELARSIEVVDFPSDDTEAMRQFCASPCVVASGNDATIATLRAFMRAEQRLIGYASKQSIAIAETRACEGEAGRTFAQAFSLDVALWDQLGCLSPTALYVVGPGSRDGALTVGRELAEALASQESKMPRGELEPTTAAAIATARSEAEMRNAGMQSGALHGSSGTQWTVSVEPDAHWRPSPLHRFVRVYAVEEIAQLPAMLGQAGAGNLSNVAVAGFDPEVRDTLGRAMSEFGASRLCDPGRMQAPPLDWPHDGLPVLTPLTRWLGA